MYLKKKYIHHFFNIIVGENMNRKKVLITCIISFILLYSLLISSIEIVKTYRDYVIITVDQDLFEVNNTEYKGFIYILLSLHIEIYIIMTLK